MSDENKEDHSRRPEDSNFKQQKLKAWQPLLTPKWVISTFFVIGLVFIPIGVVVLLASNSVKEVEVRYDESCGTPRGEACTVTLNIPEEMPQPVFFYYKLTNFYQNHRRYVKSRSDPQLSGSSLGDISGCDPLPSNPNVGGGTTIYPCGLIANSIFNDNFDGNVVLTTPSATVTLDTTPGSSTWQRTGIAWKSDREKKFKEQWPGVADLSAEGLTRTSPILNVNGTFQQLPELNSEELMVWMRTAGLPTFKKLHRIINRDIPAGSTLTVSVVNNYPVASFEGQKAIVISTTSWLGGKNDFLGLAYIVVGVVCLLLSIIFLIKHLVSPRNMGDMSYLNWSGNRAAASS